jgi:hypothetical protein
MPEVVDALVVTLNLDASGFASGSAQVDDSMSKTRASAATTAKELQARGEQASEFFQRIRNGALSLITVLVGGRGLEALISDSVTGLANLGRVAHDIGIAVPELAALRNMIEANGGSAEAATQSFQNLAQAIARAQVFGPSPELATFLGRIGANPSDSVETIYSKFNAWAQGRNPEDVITLGQMGGLDIGTIREAEKTPAQFQADLAAAWTRGVPSGQMTDDMQKLQTALRGTEQAALNLSATMFDRLAPALTAILDRITAFIEAHPDLAAAIGGGVAASGAGLAGLGAFRFLFGGSGAAAEGAGGIGALGLLGWAGAAGFSVYEGFGIGGLNSNESTDFNRYLSTFSFARGTGPAGTPRPRPDTTGRGRQAYEYFLGQGWAPIHAAALAGGIQGESGFDETQIGDNGQAVGIGQWHPDRVAAILAGTGIDVRTAGYADQLAAMQWELTHTEAAAGRALNNATTLSQSSDVLAGQYERSANPFLDSLIRNQYATGILTEGESQVSNQDWVRNLHALGGAPASNTHSEIHIGQITVNTQATDATGIARDLSAKLSDYQYVIQANSGVF